MHPPAIRATTRAEQIAGDTTPQSYDQFRGNQDVALALLMPDNTPRPDQPSFVRGTAPNPMPRSDPGALMMFDVQYRDGQAPPAGRTLHWYARPLSWAGMPAAIGDHQRVTIDDIEAYDLGTSPVAQLLASHNGIFVVFCHFLEAGRKVGEASYIQSVLEQRGIDAARELRTLMSVVDAQVAQFTRDARGNPQVVPVTAIHVDATTGAEAQLNFYMGRHPDGSVVMIMATPGTSTTHAQVQFEGATSAEAVGAFDGHNHLAPGAIHFHVPGSVVPGIDPVDRTITTTGDTTLGHLASAAGGLALALSVAAIPFTGGTSATGTVLLLGASAAGVTAGGLSLAEHLLHNEDWTAHDIALDCLQIAVSVIDLGVAFQSLRSSPALVVASRAGRYALLGSFALQGVSALLLSIDAIEQIAHILDDSTLSRQQKISALTRVVANLVVTGALLAMSYGSLNEARNRLGEVFRDRAAVVREMRDLDTAALGMLDDGVLRSLRAAERADLERLAAMIRHDPALVTRLPARRNLLGALRGCTTTEANELEVRLFRQRLRDAGIPSNNTERIISALQDGGIDGATAQLLTDGDLALLQRADDAFAGNRGLRDTDPQLAANATAARTALDGITGVGAPTRGQLRAALAHISGQPDPAFMVDPLGTLRARFPRLPADDLSRLATLHQDALLALENASEADVRSIAAQLRAHPEQDVDEILRAFFYRARRPARRTGAPYAPPEQVGDRLESALDNLQTARAPGYPFGFADQAAYERFLGTVRGSLTRRGLPSGDIRVHGSALRSPTPGDIDVAVIVDDAAFQAIGERFTTAAASATRAQRGALAQDLAKGKISSSNFFPHIAPNVGQEAASAATGLSVQVSIIRAGSEFDIGPYLTR